jgi:transcriptional regulator with XRE-family HTH domain
VQFDTFVRKLGARVRKARWASGRTQEEVAFSAGITFRVFGELERGRGNPTLRTILALARALDVTVSDLLAIEEDAKTPLRSRPLRPPKRGRKRATAPTRPR